MTDTHEDSSDGTSKQVQRVGMNGQIQSFGSTVAQLQAQIGFEQTNTLLATALCTIVVGSNDFINNYLLTDTTTKFQYNIRQYNELLLNTFNQQLTVRKINTKLLPNQMVLVLQF